MANPIEWYAFITNSETMNGAVLSGKSKKDLKVLLANLESHWEVVFIVKGKGFKPRVQRSFEFIEKGGNEIDDSEQTKDGYSPVISAIMKKLKEPDQ